MTAEGFTAHFPTEGRYAEFKEGLSDKQVRRAVVAFSNTDGGVVILGVTDEGVVKGMSLSSKRNAHLHHVLSEIHNPGRYEVFEVTVASKQVVILSVARRVEGFAQLRDGSVLGRFGASNRALIGDELSRLVNRRSLGRFEASGPLANQIRVATSAVLEEVGHEVVVLRLHRHELPRLPSVVLREAITNAVAHRSYEARGSVVRVEIHDDRVVIVSPGGLPEPVTLANIREQSAARNPAVISTLRRYGLAEDAGRGVDVMQDEMADHLLDPPEFVDSGDSVSVTLRTTGMVTPRERAWIAELEQRGPLEAKDRLLLAHAARGQELTNSYVRHVLDIDSVQSRQTLQRLRDAGLLDQRGSRGGSVYVASRGLGAEAGRHLTDEQVEESVLRLAKDGPITNAALRSRLGIDRVKALRVLDRLTDAGRLVRHGQRRWTHYTLPGQPSADL